MAKTKAGVIGVGYLGRFHAQKYAALDDVELVGVADVNPAQAEAVATECSCKAYSDYHELISEVDAVSIVVPTSYHFDVAKDCLEKGVDILLEKPVTVTLEEADALIEIADNNNCIFQVGHLERFNPAVLATKPHLTEPLFVESARINPFHNRGTDVDVVLDLMIHDIDIILNIIKSPIDHIHTVGASVATQTTDIANARIIFENGATANVTVSRISSKSTRQMRIFQPGSYLNVDFATRSIFRVKLLEDLEENGMPKQEMDHATFSDGDALKAEIEHFIHHVEHRTQPSVTGRDGRRALEVALNVMAQIKEHQQKTGFQNFPETN